MVENNSVDSLATGALFWSHCSFLYLELFSLVFSKFQVLYQNFGSIVNCFFVQSEKRVSSSVFCIWLFTLTTTTCCPFSSALFCSFVTLVRNQMDVTSWVYFKIYFICLCICFMPALFYFLLLWLFHIVLSQVLSCI